MAAKLSKGGLQNFLKFEDRETPENMKEVAERDLGETEELKKRCLQEMKDLITENGLNCITTDEFLLRFLRTEKFKVPDSFDRLQSYVTIRVDNHKTLMELRPEILEKCLRLNIAGYLPYRDAKESLIFFFKTDGWNPKVCSEKEMLAIGIVLANYASEQEYAQVTGGVLIFDNTFLNMVLLPYIVNNLYFINMFATRSLPMRYRVFHSINENALVKLGFRLVDPFMPKKIKSKIQLHGSGRRKLFHQLPPCIIPEEYGGTLGPLSNDHLVDIMLDYLQKMKDEQRYFLGPNPDESN